MSAVRVAARLARREVGRRPWRTLLVAGLVAVPVAGMVTAAAFVRTDHRSPLDEWRAMAGAADAMTNAWAGEDGSMQPALPSLPPGSRVLESRTEERLLTTTAGRRDRTQVTDLALGDPLADGLYQVTSGSVPASAGEVFLTRDAAADLGVGVGDVLRLARPAPAEWVVSGVGERRGYWGDHVVVLGPGTAFPWRGAPSDLAFRTYLVDLPPSVSDATLERLGTSGAVQLAPGLLPSVEPPRSTGEDAVRWSWVVGAVVLTVFGIVIAAAFAAGARRQLTTLGQLAANGAAPAVLRRVLFLQGTWTGVVGSALGLLLGAGVLAAVAPHLDRILGRDVDPYDVRVLDVVPAVALGVAAATVAALIPARTTSRIPVLAALAGRRPLGTVPRWLPATGALTIAAGLGLLALAVFGAEGGGGNGNVWALTAILGGVAVLLGSCALAPGYVSVLEPAGGRLRGAWRLAARSLARQRTRTGAVVSAVCATSALAVAASALVLGAEAGSDRGDRWMPADEVHLQSFATPLPGEEHIGPPVETPPDDLVNRVAAVLPGSTAHTVSYGYRREPNVLWHVDDIAPDGRPLDLGYGWGPGDGIAVATPEGRAAYRLPDESWAELRQTGALLVGEVQGDARVTMRRIAADGMPQAATPTFDAVVVPAGETGIGLLPRLVVTAAEARELGLEATAGTVVLRATEPLDGRARAAVEEAVTAYRDDLAEAGDPNWGSFGVQWWSPPGGPDPLLLEGLLAAAALVFCLFVVATSLALAAAETREERDVLSVVGASPSVLRAAGGRKAAILTALGAALAVPVGFLPVAVFVAASDGDIRLVFPWRVVVLVLVAIPVVAGAVTWLASALAGRVRPARVSTMAFE